MSNLLVGLLGALLVANLPAAVSNVVVSNLVKQPANPAAQAPDPNDPVEKEYRLIMEADDAAHDETDRWIKEDQKLSAQGANPGSSTLRARVLQRLDPVKKRYEDFLLRHPQHVRARVAYGSFLSDMGEDDEAAQQWQKARDIDPKLPSAWNNLANYYGHNGEARQAFECYEKAIELAPLEAVYYQNLATTSYLFRQEAMDYFRLSEPQVFDRVLLLYKKALELDPKNFTLATELAQTYYGFKPSDTNQTEAARQSRQAHYDAAGSAWEAALKLARDAVEREGVYVHLVRVNILGDRLAEARRYLRLITNPMYEVAKDRLQRRIDQLGTNAVTRP